MKYVFVGNRGFVLEEMLANGLDILMVIVMHNTYLSKSISNYDVPFKIIATKEEMLSILNSISYDILISNGCHFLLPINQLRKAIYVNIHPSFLPDLKGYDPNIGAILHQRDGGASCHIMDMGIDTGDIIAQEKIEVSKDLDVKLLYQLSFLAEKNVFKKALSLKFKPQLKQPVKNDTITYRRSEKDMTINFKEKNDLILSKVKAYNNLSIGARFYFNNELFKVFNADIIKNKYLYKSFQDANNLEIVLSYEDNIVFKKENLFIRFSRIVGNMNILKTGSNLLP